VSDPPAVPSPLVSAGCRSAGVLFHPTSFPGTPSCGTLGAQARTWIDLLAQAGVRVWQLLPLAPTDGQGSPYSSPSGSALNPWLLDAEDLVAEGALHASDLREVPAGGTERLEPQEASARAQALAQALARRWPEQTAHHQEFQLWCDQQRFWLRDHCLFMALRRRQQLRPWWEWPPNLVCRSWQALRAAARQERQALLEEALLQWHLERQWQRLHAQAQRQGVTLFGDLPFYVAHDSAEAWSRRGLFSMDRQGRLLAQSGVPPDYFSATGQLWGTPVYRWWVHRVTGFRWWLQRLERQLDLFDLLRLDHFRALEAYWSVAGGAPTAQEGTWCPSPGATLLHRLQRRCQREGRLRADGRLPLIAEDLGVITPEVESLRDQFQLPGMKILQFAFDGQPANPYLPANFKGSHWVVYTGTHDNATTQGWWHQLDDGVRAQVAALVGGHVQAPAWQLLEVALRSSAELVIVPLQDLLELGDQARFNTPGTTEGNWSWRLDRSLEALQGPLKGYAEMARAAQRDGDGVDGARFLRGTE
jgi:4-alpha-glucanotransferase